MPGPSGPWHGPRPAPPHRPVHTAIARALFHRVVPHARGARRAARRARIGGGGPDAPLIASAATSSSAGSAPTASSASARRSWPATGTPTIPPPCSHRSRRGMSTPGPRVDAAAAPLLRAPPAGAGANTRAGARAQHLAPLRPVERAVRAVPRRDDDLLVRAGSRPARRSSTDAQRRKIDRLLDATGVGLGHASARDRHRLGRARRAGRAARRDGHHAHPLRRSRPRSRVQRAATRRRRGRGSTSSCATTARCEGSYDAIVSVEMIEAVGVEYWPTYFATLDRAARARRPGRHPGDPPRSTTACWPRATSTRGSTSTSSPAARCRRCGRSRSRLREHTGLRVDDGRTLRRRLRAHAARLARAVRRARAEVDALGFDDTFRRMWDFYLAYCEAGFATGYLDVAQLVLSTRRP